MAMLQTGNIKGASYNSATILYIYIYIYIYMYIYIYVDIVYHHLPKTLNLSTIRYKT